MAAAAPVAGAIPKRPEPQNGDFRNFMETIPRIKMHNRYLQ
jgi:hypothetical protein